MSAASKFEKVIARILFKLYEQDIARWFSRRLYSFALIMRCVMVTRPSWLERSQGFPSRCHQYEARKCCYKELWSYTALRSFVRLSLPFTHFFFVSMLTTSSGHVKQCLDMPSESSPLAPSLTLLLLSKIISTFSNQCNVTHQTNLACFRMNGLILNGAQR